MTKWGMPFLPFKIKLKQASQTLVIQPPPLLRHLAPHHPQLDNKNKNLSLVI
jgi:hypothetical protein